MVGSVCWWWRGKESGWGGGADFGVSGAGRERRGLDWGVGGALMSGGWRGGSERRGYYLGRRGRLVLGGTINEGVCVWGGGRGGQFVCICEHVSPSRPFA